MGRKRPEKGLLAIKMGDVPATAGRNTGGGMEGGMDGEKRLSTRWSSNGQSPGTRGQGEPMSTEHGSSQDDAAKGGGSSAAATATPEAAA